MGEKVLYKCSQCGSLANKQINRCSVCRSFKIEKLSMNVEVLNKDTTLGRHSQCDLFKMPNGQNVGISVSIAVIKNQLLPVEIQALVDRSKFDNPKFTTIGLCKKRLSLIVSIFPKYFSISGNEDMVSVSTRTEVVVNVVGGVDVKKDVAIDLSIACSVASSMMKTPIDNGLIVLGEMGLNGEIKPISNMQERLDFASKFGFRRAIVPIRNTKNYCISNMDIKCVECLAETLDYLFKDFSHELEVGKEYA